MGIRSRLKDIKETLKGYDLLSFRKGTPMVIVRSDLYLSNTGLTDRLRHTLSVYLWCKDNGTPFRIHHETPFRLSDILQPASCDWRLQPGEMNNSFWNRSVVKIYSCYKSAGIPEEVEAESQKIEMDRQLSKKRQHHVFGNAHTDKLRWTEAFRELYRPSEKLQERLSSIGLPENYEAITLRFQQLLGDFKETWFKPLPEKEADELIERCISEIRSMREAGVLKGECVLITSDSRRFLDAAEKALPFIKTIPGEMAHFSQAGASTEVYMKSFVDLFALAGAQKVTLLQTGDMYLSGFPEFAATLGGIPFIVHKF